MNRRTQTEHENLRVKRALMRQQINQSHRPDWEFEIDERFHSVSMYVKQEEWDQEESTYYDQQTWERLDRFDQIVPNQRNSCSWVLYEDSLYIFGGFTFNGRLDDVHKYFFAKNQWVRLQTTGQKPTARENNGAVLYKGCMYVFGGCDGSSWLNDFYALNLKTLTWRKIEPTGQCPSNRFGFACGTYQSKMMIFGGFDGTHQLSDAYTWDFETQIWDKLQLIGDVPSARSCLSFSSINVHMYMFGGFDGVNRLNDFYKINIFTGKVKRISQHGTIPCPRYFHTSEIYQNKLLLFGGFNGQARLNDLYEFDFGSKTWTKLEVHDPPKGRSSMVFQLYNDSLFIFGGYDGDDLLNDIYKLEFKNAKIPRSSFISDLRSLINNPQMSDVVFVVEDHQIYANRCILGARSEHFQNLFFEEFRDKEQVYIEIHDCGYTTFMDMLFYMYTDQLDSSLCINRLLSLIILSDQYLLQRLKYLCEELLISKINCNNVVELILFSKKYNCKLLRIQTMKQLVDNIATIKRRKDFNRLAQEPDILIEIIQKKC